MTEEQMLAGCLQNNAASQDALYSRFSPRMLGVCYRFAKNREEAIPSIIQAKEVVECIRVLPLGYRTVLNLYAIEGYSHKEIGNMLDIEESTSRSQYTRAKAMLEDILIKKRILIKPKQKAIYIAEAVAF